MSGKRLLYVLHHGDSFSGVMHWGFALVQKYRQAIPIALAVLCLLSLVSAPLFGLHTDSAKAESGGLADTPWPMFGHDLQHTGRSPYTGPQFPQNKWSFTTEGLIEPSPTIAADGTIYVGSLDHKLYAIRPDGLQKWSFVTGGGIYSSPAIAGDGTIYVGSIDSKLYAINPDGSQKWSFTTGSFVSSSPAIAADGTIYVGSCDNKVYAINPDGSQKWSFTTGDDIYSSSPAVATDGTIYVGCLDCRLYALNPDGSQKWTFATERGIYGSPAVAADGTVYIGSDYVGDGFLRDVLCALSSDGSLKWRSQVSASRLSRPAIAADGTIYIGGSGSSEAYRLYALNPDGSQKWSLYDAAGFNYACLAIAADGTIYVTAGNTLTAISEARPQADFTATSTNGVAPLAVEFNDQSIGGVTSWSWDFDSDGTVDSTERNPLHTYGTVGNYTVSLTVTGPGGSDTETKTDYIHVIPSESALDQIQAEVNWWRGLAFLEEVNRGFMTQEEYRERIIIGFAQETDEISTTQELWCFLDLMGKGQDLHDILVNLYSEVTAGFYNYELKELYVIGNEEEMGPVEKVTFAHEYTHALQDQHFDPGSFLPSPEGDSDVYVAAQSLVEGDAEFLQWVYYWGSLDDAERAAYDQEMAEYDDSAFEAAPQILQEQILFPYTSGADFVAALLEEGGWDAVNQAYSDPPQSTEQILHPERYLNRDEPQAVSMPDLKSALGTGWTQLDSDVMGEFGMRVYLETFVDTEEAAVAAAGWDGDRYVFLKDAEGRRVLALSSVWDSVGDASEFFDTYVDFVAEKSGGSWTLLQEDDGRRWWQTAGLSLYLGQAGSEVLIVMAPDAVVAGQVLSEFPEFYTVPQAGFSASLTQAIVGQVIELADSSTGDITSWAWDFDHDGVVDSTEQNPSHSYAEPGTYTVSLTVSSPAAGDTETKVEYITVYTAPQADFSASLTQAAVGQAIEFADSSTGDITSWAWDFDHDGLVDSTEQNPSYTYPNPGKYTVSLKVTGPGGSDNEVKSDFVTVSAVSAPELAGINPSSGRQGETLTVTVSGENLAEVSAIIFGQGITVNGFTVDSTTRITANITISADAVTGPRDVSVTTPGGTGSLPSGFTVDKAAKSGGGLFDCSSCSSSKKETSVAGLLIGWVAVGFAGGTGYYLVRRAARGKRTRFP